ncbi:MAG: trigger factor [Frankiaceae bacterium]|nr:trigger factor [Frankiaceae bacterium]
MQSAVETLSPTRVRLTVTVPFDELKPELDAAYKKVGGQVRIQGFRPGKVPPRILDQRVGRGVVLDEAVNSAIPRLYGEALQAEDLAPVSQPDLNVTEFADGDKLAFTAEVDIRPHFDIPSFESLTVTVDDVAVDETKVDEQLEALRERFSKLSPVERAAKDGDYVSIDLAATVDGDEVPGGTAAGLSYQVGSGDLLEGIDDVLRGASAGDATTFQTTLVAGEFEGRLADVAVTVRAVQERELPALDDNWATDSTGFESLEALTSDIRSRLDRVQRLEQGVAARDKVLEALLAQIDVPLPESVVESEIAWRKQATEAQLSRAGADLAGYLENEGKSEADFESEMQGSARDAVKAQLVLDAIADKEEIGVNDAELTDQVVRRAARAGVSPDDYAQTLVQSGQLSGLISEVRRGKALATVMEAATITDSSGNTIDLDQLRDDLSGPGAPGQPAPQVDDDGRPYHLHDDGAVHYLDED